jgi:hypothetical protein
MQPEDPVVSKEQLQELDNTQWNPAYHDVYDRYQYPHGPHYKDPRQNPGYREMLCCWFHPEARRTKREEPTPPPVASEKVPDMPTLAVLYNYIQAENKASKLQLVSLQCLVNDILTEIKKLTTTTAPQPEIQVPKTDPAPLTSRLEKWKRTTLGDLSPMPQPPMKAVQAALPQPPSPTPIQIK